MLELDMQCTVHYTSPHMYIYIHNNSGRRYLSIFIFLFYFNLIYTLKLLLGRTTEGDKRKVLNNSRLCLSAFGHSEEMETQLVLLDLEFHLAANNDSLKSQMNQSI